VRSDLVVVGSPSGNGLLGLSQRFKPVLIQAFIAGGTVETLDVSVLGRAAGFDQDVFDAVLLRPCYEGPASEFRSVIGSDFLRVCALAISLNTSRVPSSRSRCAQEKPDGFSRKIFFKLGITLTKFQIPTHI
jgi:hypothetical protein